MNISAAAAKSLQSCPTLCDPNILNAKLYLRISFWKNVNFSVWYQEWTKKLTIRWSFAVVSVTAHWAVRIPSLGGKKNTASPWQKLWSSHENFHSW